jgi:hypothetical protein
VCKGDVIRGRNSMFPWESKVLAKKKKELEIIMATKQPNFLVKLS